MTDTTFPAKDCCTPSGSRRTGNVSTALLLLLQSHKNYFHPPPRLYKLLVFRLQCVKKPERCVPLDLALVMVTSLHSRRGNTETWQPLDTFLQSQHPTTALSWSLHRLPPHSQPPRKALYLFLQLYLHNGTVVQPQFMFFEVRQTERRVLHLVQLCLPTGYFHSNPGLEGNARKSMLLVVELRFKLHREAISCHWAHIPINLKVNYHSTI